MKPFHSAFSSIMFLQAILTNALFEIMNDNPGRQALLKEYELCFNGIQHHNTRIWASGAIFITGSYTASGWLINQGKTDIELWINFLVVTLLILFTYFLYENYKTLGHA